MDRRLMERRRRVAEERARSNLGRLVKVLAGVAFLAAGVWFVQSPFMSVGRITVKGADRVDVASVLEEHRIVAGRPLILLDVDAAEGALRGDPWVRSSEVARDWPRAVVVEVEERRPAAVVQLRDGYWLASADAVLLERAPDSLPDLPAVVLSDLGREEAEDSLELEGAVEYVTTLPREYRSGTVVRQGVEGLEATVAGYQVRVGRPFDTAEKAVVTAAMIESGVEEGAVLTVVAPASPAVLPPGAADEQETTTTTTP